MISIQKFMISIQKARVKHSKILAVIALFFYVSVFKIFYQVQMLLVQSEKKVIQKQQIN